MVNETPFSFDDDDWTFWLSLLEAISSSYFDSFSYHLGFPFELTTEITHLAQNSAIIVLNSIGDKIPISPSIPISDLPKENLDEFFAHTYQETFNKFELQNYGMPIYLWGKAQILKDKMYSKTIGFPSNWDALLLKWADNGANDLLIYFTPLKLPNMLISELKTIVLKYHLRYYLIKAKIHMLENWLKIDAKQHLEWDVYLFASRRTGTWIANQISLNQQILMWKDIFSVLSGEQLSIFEYWGHNNMQSNQISIPEFSIVEIAKGLLLHL